MATKKTTAKKPTAKKATKPKKKTAPVKGDVSNKPRQFVVYVDRKILGEKPAGVIVEVAPGEDADKVCDGVLNDMIANEIYTGWYEASIEDIERYG